MEKETRTVRFEMISIYEIETDMATSDKEAIAYIRQELEECNLEYTDNPDVDYIGWDVGRVSIVK